MLRAARPVLLCLLVIVPAILLRLSGAQPVAPVALLIYGSAVVAASFVLAWAAEAAEVDISGGLTVALLAVIAVLPEYAVDLYFAYRAGERPEYVQYAAANMTGSNRLLLGLGWSVVVLISLFLASRQSGRPVKMLILHHRYRLELGFLLVASLIALVIPLTGEIHLVLGIALLGFFVFYLIRVSRGDGTGNEERELVGPAARIGRLAAGQRRPLVIAMFAGSALAILACAEPFAEALVGSGTALGIDHFLLVQWLAPLASEAPEFIVAILFAVRGNAAMALVLDSRQVEEMVLTATQALMGVAILLMLRFPRWAAWTLLGLFAVQFAIPGTQGRYLISVVYAVIALISLIKFRHQILPTLTAPFRGTVPAPTRQPDSV